MVCHPNTDSYRDMDPDQIFRQHEAEKKRQSPLVFSRTGGMAVECKRYHSKQADLIATKKGENYATTMLWIRAKVIPLRS